MRSIFWRIFGFFWLALVLTGLLTFLVTRFFNQDAWLLSSHPGLQNLAQQWSQLHQSGQEQAARRLLLSARRDYHLTVQIFAEEGQLLASNTRPRHSQHTGHLNTEPSPGLRRLTQELELDDGSSLLFVYRIPNLELHKWQNSRGLGGVTLLTVAMLVITLASLLLTLSITRPLTRLRQAVHELGEAAYQQQHLAKLAHRKDELGVLAADFNRMGERLQDMLKSQRQLLRDVSHELRSPLARLKVGLALAERATDEKRQAMWPRLEQECSRLDSLIDEILNLARLEQVQSSAERFALRSLLQKLAEDHALLHPEIPVQLDCPVELQLHSKADILERALDNLLRNALRFSPAQGQVELQAIVEKDAVRICVKDTGPGIDPALLPRITAPFVRAPGQESQGHGLGLAIVQRCVEQLGGRLELNNHPQAGLQACIQLPLQAVN